LAQDWAAICHRIGWFVELPVVNASASVPFEAAIPGSLRQRYAADFEKFGYRF
jgi:hypothetical protein